MRRGPKDRDREQDRGHRRRRLGHRTRHNERAQRLHGRPVGARAGSGRSDPARPLQRPVPARPSGRRSGHRNRRSCRSGSWRGTGPAGNAGPVSRRHGGAVGRPAGLSAGRHLRQRHRPGERTPADRSGRRSPARPSASRAERPDIRRRGGAGIAGGRYRRQPRSDGWRRRPPRCWGRHASGYISPTIRSASRSAARSRMLLRLPAASSSAPGSARTRAPPSSPAAWPKPSASRSPRAARRKPCPACRASAT